MDSKLKEIKPKLSAIDIPTDFKELVNMQPLITQIEIFEMLKKNLDKYRYNYFESKQHTATQVLAIIPEDQWQEYYENTFKVKNDPRPNVKHTDLVSLFKHKYTQYSKYGEASIEDPNTGKRRGIKHGEIYYLESKEILIDTVKRKLFFVLGNIDHGHQYYGCKVKYHLKQIKTKGIQILTVEFLWSFIPWYSNMSSPKYFSHFYEFDLTNDRLHKIDVSQMMR